jgi:hypothetical protein
MPTHFYVSFPRDTIYLEYSFDMPSFGVATRFLGPEVEKIEHLALDFEYCAFDLKAYREIRSLPRLNDPIFVAETTRGSVRRWGRTCASLKSLEMDYRRPEFQGFPFRFMFQDLSEYDGFLKKSLESHGKLFANEIFRLV